MVLIRLTASLVKKSKLKVSEPTQSSENSLGEWYAHDFRLGSSHFILCVCAKTRIGIVIPAAPYQKFAQRLKPELAKLLREIGINESVIEAELKKMEGCAFGKTQDRSVLGTVSENIKHLQFLQDDHRFDGPNYFSMTKYVTNIPCSALRDFPIDLTFDAFKLPRREKHQL
jgi:hypothetical protein